MANISDFVKQKSLSAPPYELSFRCELRDPDWDPRPLLEVTRA